MPRVVHYEFEFAYRFSRTGGLYPILSFRVNNPRSAALSVEVNGFLDSGAKASLFDGSLLKAIGANLLDGPHRVFSGPAGNSWSVRMHDVHLAHELLGRFALNAGFSETPVERNILGRDFFNLAQIGFREHHLTFYVTPHP